MTPVETVPHSLKGEDLAALQQAFAGFQNHAEKLDHAYRAMQADFKKLNIELDSKNRELAESLRTQQETRIYLDSILQSMHNGVIGVDLLGRITQFNRAAAEITGFSESEAKGKSYEELFGTANHQGTSLTEALGSGRELPLAEKTLWRSDRRPVPVSFQTALLKDQQGELLGAVEVFTDISRIKALEEEMRQARTLAALGEMSATVAHEIRNPLGAMGVWAGLLDRDIAPEDPRKRTLSRIIEGLSRLNRIVTSLLVYTRPVKAEFRKVNLHDVVNEIADFMEIEIERQKQSIQVQRQWDLSRQVQVIADPEKIQQVIMNLCLNAMQAMPGGGILTIRVDLPDLRRPEYASLAIEDTGIGIAPESLEKIFDPFFTTKETGTGLGLAIVKKFVESHSGFVDVHSTPGSGTSVRVFLPSAAA